MQRLTLKKRLLAIEELTTTNRLTPISSKEWGIYSAKVVGSVILLTAIYSAVSYIGAHTAAAALNSSGSGGLVGAPINPHYCQANGLVHFADYGYDSAPYISRAVTFLTFITVLWWPLAKGTSIRRMIFQLAYLGCIPIIVHLVGLCLINNYGGLGAEL